MTGDDIVVTRQKTIDNRNRRDEVNNAINAAYKMKTTGRKDR